MRRNKPESIVRPQLIATFMMVTHNSDYAAYAHLVLWVEDGALI